MLKNQLFLAIRPVCWAFPEEKLLHQKWGKCERRCLYWSQRETQWFRYSCVSDPCELCFAHDGAIQQVTGKGGYSMKRMCVVLLQALTSDRQSTVHIPPVLTFFLHIPPLNILLWKNPFKRYCPPPLRGLKISRQDHLFHPHLVIGFSEVLTPPQLMAGLLTCSLIALNTSLLSISFSPRCSYQALCAIDSSPHETVCYSC